MWSFDEVPFDVLPPILEELDDHRDLRAACLVNTAFCKAATPLLYRSLDSRIISQRILYHPCSTLLRRPELTKYVRHVTETGAVHRTLQAWYPNVTSDTLKAIRLCVNLESMTWIDDSFTAAPQLVLAFLDAISELPVKSLTLQTHSDLGEDVWDRLKQITGLRKVAIWCMDGPPRVLQGWSDKLGSTLTHLELGVSSLSSSRYHDFLSQLPHLRSLRMKGAPSASIPTILGYLPSLDTLDTDYFGSSRFQPAKKPVPRLCHLTVRASSMDAMGPQRLWQWIHQITPRPSLQSFVLNAFSVQGQTPIPRRFIQDLAAVHHNSLKQFLVGSAQLHVKDLEYLCLIFPLLEDIVCYVAVPDAEALCHAVEKAENLRSIKLHVVWLTNNTWTSKEARFTKHDAMKIMSRPGSRIRTVAVEADLYRGFWTHRHNADGEAKQAFEVVKAVNDARWA